MALRKLEESRQRAEKRQKLASERARIDDRKKTKRRLMEMKPKSYWMHRAQAACNAYIRFRDRAENCICCDKPFEREKIGGSVDAGHFIAVSLSERCRFDIDNIFAQRKNCNRPGGTTAAKFEAGVLKRIGPERLARLKEKANDPTPCKYTIEDYKGIEADFKTMLRSLQDEVAA